MRRQYRLLLQALLVAMGLLIGMRAALYAADENQTPGETGLVLVAIDPEGPAAAAGVVRGDILLAVDKTPVNTVAELQQALAATEPGATVTLQVQHGDEQVTYTMKTVDRNAQAYLGLLPYGEPRTMPPMRLAQPLPPQFGAPGAEVMTQLVVLDVVKGSAGDKAGLQVKDLITAINGEAVTDAAALQAQLTTLKPGDVITLTVMRVATEEPVTVAVTLGKGEAGQAQIGVKLGVMASFTRTAPDGAAPEFQPRPPQMARPFYFYRRPHFAPREHRFFHFRRPDAPTFHYFMMPQPGFDMQQEFMSAEGDWVMSMPAQPGQWVERAPLPPEAPTSYDVTTPYTNDWVTVFPAQPGVWAERTPSSVEIYSREVTPMPSASPFMPDQQGWVIAMPAVPGPLATGEATIVELQQPGMEFMPAVDEAAAYY